jgi:hypothetical protein
METQTPTPTTLLSAALTAQWLGCTEGYVYYLARTKRLKPARKDRVMFDPATVLKFRTAYRPHRGRPRIGHRDVVVAQQALREVTR